MRAKGHQLGKSYGRETWWRDALSIMLVTELTSHDDRSELKEEAELNTAQEECVRAKGQHSAKPK